MEFSNDATKGTVAHYDMSLCRVETEHVVHKDMYLAQCLLPDILDFFDTIMMDKNWEKQVPMAVLSQLGL